MVVAVDAGLGTMGPGPGKEIRFHMAPSHPAVESITFVRITSGNDVSVVPSLLHAQPFSTN